MSIITISHEAFGDGRAVAERVAAILGYRCISREVLVKASQCYGMEECLQRYAPISPVRLRDTRESTP